MDIGPLAPVGHQRAYFANSGGCRHSTAEPVTTVDGEHVGWLCPECDAVLPPDRSDWPPPELPPFTPDPRLTTRI